MQEPCCRQLELCSQKCIEKGGLTEERLWGHASCKWKLTRLASYTPKRVLQGSGWSMLALTDNLGTYQASDPSLSRPSVPTMDMPVLPLIMDTFIRIGMIRCILV